MGQQLPLEGVDKLYNSMRGGIIMQKKDIFIPRHTIVAGYYGFTLDVRVSVRPSVRPSVSQSYVRPSVRPSVFFFRFRMIT